MKDKERLAARKLRSEGKSMNEIVQMLGVSKASVSNWVREIALSKDQIARLGKRGVEMAVIERRRSTRLTKENARRQDIIDLATDEIKKISTNELRLIGAALYWAEGSKTKRGVVEFCNGDPQMIQLMMKFFTRICEVVPQKFRGYIHIHPHLDVKNAERYWSQITDIPLSQFYKTYCKPNRASKNKKDTLPYGTFSIYVCDTRLWLTLLGWRKKIFSLSVRATL